MRVRWALHHCHSNGNSKTVKTDNFCNTLQTVATAYLLFRLPIEPEVAH